MNDNIVGILSTLGSNISKYESGISREGMTYHERVLDMLEEDYCRFFNHDEWLRALEGYLTELEAEVWCEIPMATRTEQGITLAELKKKVRPEIAMGLESVISSLIKKSFLYESEGRFTTPYLLNVLGDGILDYGGTPLDKACLNWWREMCYNPQESSKLRAPYPVMRIIPNEATITGQDKFGKIPMNLEIPDTRHIVEDYDELSRVLAKCRRFAVVDCICRKANDDAGDRKCSNPLEVCILIDEDADGGIELGAREVTYDEVMDIVKMCRDKGLVQAISSDEHPLALCNCCECCCIFINNLNRGESICDVSRFVVDVAHNDECIKCGKCMKKCPAGVLDVRENHILLRTAKCIGCGVCVSQCPKGVLSLIPKPGAQNKTFQEPLKRCYL